MFDIGFSELLIIALVALVVIGPERLPRVARTAGHLLGRLQRYVSDVKTDINREIQLDELKKIESQAKEAKKKVTGKPAPKKKAAKKPKNTSFTISHCPNIWCISLFFSAIFS